jgi:hypothetical protein
VVDIRGHDCPIEAQFAALGDVKLAGQVHDVIKQAMERGGLEELGPPMHGALVWHRRHIHPTKLAQHQTVPDRVSGLGEAPPIEGLDDQQAQNDRNRRRGTPIRRSCGKAAH